MSIGRALKNIGDWISKETESRKYPKSELLELSESLQALNAEIARQSVKSEEVAEAIEYFEDTLQFIVGEPQEKDHRLAITALQAYQPWIPVSNIKPEKSGRYIAYVPEHWTAEGHKEGKVIIAYFRELNYEGRRRVWDDGSYGVSGEVTHYLPLPEPPKGE